MNAFRNLKALTTQMGRVQWERKLECGPPWTPWPEGGSKAILRTGADPLHRSSGDRRQYTRWGWEVWSHVVGLESRPSGGTESEQLWTWSQGGASRQGNGLLRVLKIRKCESVCE